MNTLPVQSKDQSQALSRESSTRRAGEALPSLRHETKDVLKQLHANINHLEDLGGRLGFVLSEVRSLIRR